MEDANSYIRKVTGKNKGYPGAQPIVLDPKKSYNFSTFYIANKFDGERMLVFGWNNKSYQMDRKGTIQQILFFVRNGDVFDTEKVNQDYYILDFIAENEKVLDLPFYKRIRLFLSIKSYSKSNLKPKLFLDFKKQNEKILEKERKKLKQPFEGYIFTVKTTPVTFITTSDILKWKPLELNTVDFLYKDGKLFVGTKNGLVERGKFIGTGTGNDVKIENGQIIECKPGLFKDTWEFFRFRNDKTKPNFITVYNSTFKTIQNFKPLEFPI